MNSCLKSTLFSLSCFYNTKFRYTNLSLLLPWPALRVVMYTFALKSHHVFSNFVDVCFLARWWCLPEPLNDISCRTRHLLQVSPSLFCLLVGMMYNPTMCFFLIASFSSILQSGASVNSPPYGARLTAGTGSLGRKIELTQSSLSSSTRRLL